MNRSRRRSVVSAYSNVNVGLSMYSATVLKNGFGAVYYKNLIQTSRDVGTFSAIDKNVRNIYKNTSIFSGLP